MTPFEKRIERIASKLGPLPQKMTFVYEDGHRVEVTGFLEAARQATKGEGIVDVLGASEGLKNFLLCSQCDIRILWDDEGSGGNTDNSGGQGPELCPAAPATDPAELGRPQADHPRPGRRCGAVRKPAPGGETSSEPWPVIEGWRVY